MNKELKDLVKKHFNLVDAAPAVVEETVATEVELSTEEVMEETTNEAFGEIATADGELTLTYEGEELVEGLPIFVKTEDGNIPAPDGTHELEGGITISTEGGVVTSTGSEVEAEEIEEEMSDDEELKEELSSEETNSLHNDFKELLELLSAEFKAELKTIKEEFTTQLNEVKGNVETFSAAPATEKTITNTKQTYGKTSSVDLTFNPINDSKRAQFERLVKRRKN